MMAQRTTGQQRGGGSAPRFRVTHTGEIVPVDGMPNSEAVQRHFAANREPLRAGGVSPPVDERNTNESHSLVQRVTSTIVAATAQPELSHAHASELTATQNPDKAATEAVYQQQARQLRERMQQPPAQRSQNWALQGVTQFTTGISRYVDIRCEADRFVLLAQGGLAKAQEIPITGSVSTATDQLVGAIWEFQHSWDSAGTNTHWRPILRVRVAPGGEQRLRELQALLRNSGLVVETW